MDYNTLPNEEMKGLICDNKINAWNEIDFDQIEDYGQLTVLLVQFILQMKNAMTIQQTDSNHFKLLMKKDLGYEQLYYFKELFEHLTMQNLKIIENELLDEWLINFIF